MKAGWHFTLLLAFLCSPLPALADEQPVGGDAVGTAAEVRPQSKVGPVRQDLATYIAVKDDLDMWPFGPMTTLESGARARSTDAGLRFSWEIEDLAKIKLREQAEAVGLSPAAQSLLALEQDFGFDFWVSKLVLLFIAGAATITYNKNRHERRIRRNRKRRLDSAVSQEEPHSGKREIGKVYFLKRRSQAEEGKDAVILGDQ